MEQYDQILCLLVPLAAVYCGYLWVSQVVLKQIPPFNLLLPRGAYDKNCKDINGYFKDSNPYITILMVASAVFGAIDVCATYYENLVPFWLQNGAMIGYIAFLVVFSRGFAKITDKYWKNKK